MSNNLLSSINSPTDLRQLDVNQLPQLAQELRDFIIDVISVKEGHDLAHLLKDTLRSEIPELGHVLIHVEPN